MRVLMISKAFVVGMYQRKLEELAHCPEVQLTVAVPPYWREGHGALRLERLYTAGYELRVLPMTLNGSFHLHFYPGLGALVRQVQPDLLHIDEEPYNLATFQAMRLARQRHIPALFFTWQNLLRRYPFPFRFFERYNLAHAAYVIAGNEEAQAILRQKGYPGPIAVLPQVGVDPDLYHPEEPPPSRKGGLVIGYLGRMVREKGVQVLLRAAAGLAGDWSLRLVGNGPFLPDLQALCAQLGLQQRTTFSPRVPSAEVPQWLNGLDVLVLPSLTQPNWKEQFGRVLIEAMACEVPVIGSSCGEIPHLIGDAGLVFPEGDEAALRAALQKLMDDPQLRWEMGQRGRGRALQNYTQQRIAAQTCAIYRQVLATNPR